MGFLRMIVSAIVFSLLFVAIAYTLVFASIHGPDSLRAFALIYLIVANVVWWWSFVRFRRVRVKTRYFILEGIGLLALGPAFGTGAYLYAEAKDWYRVQHTRITDVRDELLNDAGRPVGISLYFTAEFPLHSYYWIEASLEPPDGYSSRIAHEIPARAFHLAPLRMRAIAKSVEPFPAGEDATRVRQDEADLPAFGLRFERGIAYRFRFDLVPSYLRKTKQDALCIAYPADDHPSLPRDVFGAILRLKEPTRWAVRITDTPYGDWRSDQAPPQTAREYSPATFHDGIMAGNPARCAEPVVY
jgi:hypothetical protein